MVKDFIPNLKQLIIDQSKSNNNNSIEKESKLDEYSSMTAKIIESHDQFREQIIDRFDKVNHELHYQAKFISDVEVAIKNIKKSMTESLDQISSSKVESINTISQLSNEVNCANTLIKH